MYQRWKPMEFFGIFIPGDLKKKLAASSRAFTFSWGSVVFKAWAWWSRTYDLSISFIRRWVPFTTGCLIDSQVQDGHKMETKQLYKGYRRIVQGLYKGYHTSKPKNPRSWILNLDRSETSVRGREHCSQVSSTYYFEYLLIWQRNLARPFNSFFLFSHLKILQEKVKRKNNNKTHHEVQPSTCRPAAKDTSLASRATSIWANASQSWLCIFFKRRCLNPFFNRTNTKYHLIEAVLSTFQFTILKLPVWERFSLFKNHLPNGGALSFACFQSPRPLYRSVVSFVIQLTMLVAVSLVGYLWTTSDCLGCGSIDYFKTSKSFIYISLLPQHNMTPHESMNTYIFPTGTRTRMPLQKINKHWI